METDILQAVIDHLADGVVVVDPKGWLVLANPAAVRMLNQPVQKIPVQEWTRAYGMFRHTGEPFPPEELPVALALRGIESNDVEVVARAPDGKEIVFLANGRPMRDAEGKVIGGVMAFREITARRNFEKALRDSEERLSAIISQTPNVAVESVSMDGTVLAWNPAAEQIFGWEWPEAVGRDVGDLLFRSNAEERARFLAALRRIDQTDQPIGPIPWRCATKSGRMLTLYCTMFAISSAKRGKEFICIAVDITPLNESQERLEDYAVQQATLAKENARLLEATQQAVKVRDEFISAASHELRTPLTPLKLQLEAALRFKQNEPDDPLVGRLSTAQRQVTRLSKMLDGMLDVSRITAGKLELQKERVDLGALVREVAERHREESLKAGCPLTLRLNQNAIGQWDPMRVDQVVTNLVTNAFKYGKGKPVDIYVESDGDMARLRVIDHGIGIPAEDQNRIFQRFERTQEARHFGGLGMGLWIVDQILKAHGGKVSVQSNVGQGSTFTAELPMSD